MAPRRPPRVDYIYDESSFIGVLVCRADGDQAREMALNGLIVDLGRPEPEAREWLSRARVRVSRWYKTPDIRDVSGYAWILNEARAGSNGSGATPGVLFSEPL